ncbi:MAG: 6-O-methylguanine DNA methyltransferase [Gemmatimonadales bacterium]|nr:6-O-methylguanine DNA methyltransferase [Candidatus Palauibacter irciniicola]MYC17889.1 6-O-methylguanine DNA methyltransferase [Gemmatimonadales bacterium]
MRCRSSGDLPRRPGSGPRPRSTAAGRGSRRGLRRRIHSLRHQCTPRGR